MIRWMIGRLGVKDTDPVELRVIEHEEFAFWKRHRWFKLWTDPADEPEEVRQMIEEVRKMEEAPRGWPWKKKGRRRQQ